MRWTDEVVARTIKLWNEGCSADEICQRLNIKSRSAVAGKIHRLRASGDQRILIGTEKTALRASSGNEKERDQEDLFILQRRDWDKATWASIGNDLGTTARSCSDRYHRIISALAQSEAA